MDFFQEILRKFLKIYKVKDRVKQEKRLHKMQREAKEQSKNK
jgi:hypothetical protein